MGLGISPCRMIRCRRIAGCKGKAADSSACVYGDPLPLAAAEFMRVECSAFLAESDQLQGLRHMLSHRSPASAGCRGQGLGDDIGHTHVRIQRAIRVLEHCLHGTAIAGESLFGKGAHLLAMKEQRARSRFGQQQEELCQSGFA